MSLQAISSPEKQGFPRRALTWWGPRPVTQAIVAVFVLLAFYLLMQNMFATMDRIGIRPGFEFLTRSANFEIGESSIAFQSGNPYWLAITVGLINTVKVALLGCLFATILGVVVGVAGLSKNLLLGSLIRWYVEIIRNTPLLLQLFFWMALIQAFPVPRKAFVLFDSFYLSNRGVYVPGLTGEGITLPVIAGLAFIAIFALAFMVRDRQRKLLNPRRLAVIVAGAVAVGYIFLRIAGAHISADVPALSGFNIRGGHVLTPEFAALLIGLTVKFSATIAEIVRAGIQSVRAGQWEAARALGLHDAQIVRLVVLPQALRVMTPLMTSSYLDLTKDSSLAVAIGYPDLVSIVNTTANTTGQSFEALAILIGIYLVLNISVSIAMNIYNRRVALRGGALL